MTIYGHGKVNTPWQGKDQTGWKIIQPCCILGMVQSVPLVHLFLASSVVFLVFLTL